MLTAFIAASVLNQTAPPAPPMVEAPQGPVTASEVKPAAAPPEPPQANAEQFAAKLRFGVGSFQGFNLMSSDNGCVGLLGAYVRLGWQLTPHWGAELEGAASTIGFTSVLRGAGWVSFTAIDWLSFGLGAAAGIDEWSAPDLFGGNPHTGSANYAALVARIDFTVVSSHNETGGRRAFIIGLQGEAGVQTGGQTSGSEVGLYLTMGFVYW